MGSLQQMDGTAIAAVPCVVTDSAKRVRFIPDTHTSGNATATLPNLYATFKYTATTGSTGFNSAEETVTVVVTPVNHAPVLTAGPMTLNPKHLTLDPISQTLNLKP